MKKREIIELHKNLHKVANLKGVKFTYAVARNIDLLEPEVKAIMKANEYSEEYLKYDQARLDLNEKHAQKGPDGKAIQEMRGNQSHYVIADNNAFDKDYESLKKKHAKALKDREKQEKEYEQLLEEEHEVKLHMIDLANVPDEIVSAQMNAIIKIINPEVVE